MNNIVPLQSADHMFCPFRMTPGTHTCQGAKCMAWIFVTPEKGRCGRIPTITHIMTPPPPPPKPSEEARDIQRRLGVISTDIYGTIKE